MKLYNIVFYFISGHGSGWAFSSTDLIKKFERQQIDNVLSDLVKDKKILKSISLNIGTVRIKELYFNKNNIKSGKRDFRF